MRKELSILLVGLLVAWGAASAKTQHSRSPAQGSICDGQTGRAFALCKHFCEDMGCDQKRHDSDKECNKAKHDFEEHTGDPLPCQVACPCVQQFPLFAALAGGGQGEGDGEGDHRCEERKNKNDGGDEGDDDGDDHDNGCPGGGGVVVTSCIASPQLVSVATPQGTFAIVNGATMPPFCSVNLVPPFVNLTPPEVAACRDLLLKAAARQGVACLPPE